MLSRILDKATEDLSECLEIIWHEKEVWKNEKNIKLIPRLGELKQRLDQIQELLLELQTYLERFEQQLTTSFYWVEA